MSTSISGTQIEVTVQGTLIRSQNQTQGQASDNFVYQALLALASGTGAGKANQIWRDRRTLAASATENLDLNGVLTDSLGDTITLTKVKAILVKADPGNTNKVLVGGAASNAFLLFADATDIMPLNPGQTFATFVGAADAVGIVVTAATGDILKIANSSGTTGVTYDIVIIGE